MKNVMLRILWAIPGVLLIVLGVLCFSNLSTALLSLVFILGIVMLVSGMIDVVIFAANRERIIGGGWILADGILTIILAFFLFINPSITAFALPFIFGMWVLFAGVAKLVHSFDLQKLNVRGWGWFTALGILETLAGFLALFQPVAGAFALSILMGILLILRGVTAIINAFFSPRLMS